MNRQRLLLVGLAGLLVLALAYAFWASPRQRVAPEEGAPPGRRVVESPAVREEAPPKTRVRLELLRREGEEFAGYRRDIFNYPPPPTPPPTAPPARPTGPPSVEQPFVPPEGLEEPPSFTFLGFIEKGEERTVFLASAGEIFLARVGEPFGDENEYRLSEVTEEKLTIRYGEDDRSVAIPITEPPLPSAPTGGFPAPSPQPDLQDREVDFSFPQEAEEAPLVDEVLPQDENGFAADEDGEDGEVMGAGGGGTGNNEEAADE